jgi:hypothetical protein
MTVEQLAEALMSEGFTYEQAWAMARAGYGVVRFEPLGWELLPIDEHLARIEVAS